MTTTNQLEKKRVLSGMRPTGRLHLGNYMGGAKGMIELQNDPTYETFYMVADVHAITTPYDKEELRTKRKAVVKDYLAAGLDPQKSAIFFQSMVPQHLELSVYLSSVITIARLQHLPTFKEKVKQYPEHSTMALLEYPILMAADILVYKAGLVPVGIDQEPHLEVAREIAKKMNNEYGTTFLEPQRFATSGEYVPSLLGEGKMSKSVEGSYISLTDDLNTIKEKLAKVATDAGIGTVLPTEGAVPNLLYFVELFQGKEKRHEYEHVYLTAGLKYQSLKQELAESIYTELQPVQERYASISDAYVLEVINEGSKRAKAVAAETLMEVKEKMGFQ